MRTVLQLRQRRERSMWRYDDDVARLCRDTAATRRRACCFNMGQTKSPGTARYCATHTQHAPTDQP